VIGQANQQWQLTPTDGGFYPVNRALRVDAMTPESRNGMRNGLGNRFA
jgi:hypothetical protein